MTSKTLTQVQNQIAATINKETGAEVDVTICGDSKVGTKAHFYTEQIDKLDGIKSLLAQIDSLTGLIYEQAYEADEDMPAAVTLIYSLK